MGAIRYNPWLDAGNSAEQTGGIMAQLMMAMPQLRMQQATQAADMAFKNRQLMMEQQKLDAQIPTFGAEAARWNAAAGKDVEETGHLKALMDAAKNVEQGTYSQFQPRFQTPAINVPSIVSPMLDTNVPSRNVPSPETNPQQDALAKQYAQVAMAQMLKDPSKVGEAVASMRFNAGTQEDDPARMFAAAFGKYPTVQQASAGETVYDPLTRKTLQGQPGHNSVIPFDEFRNRQLIEMLAKSIPQTEMDTDKQVSLFNRLAGQGGVKPPGERQLGERMTTSAGTFEWSERNGQQGWKQIK